MDKQYVEVEKAALMASNPDEVMRLWRAGALAYRIIGGKPCVRVEALTQANDKIGRGDEFSCRVRQ